jgi:hypothetical protein
MRPVPERQSSPPPAMIRDTARNHGIDVPDRGRIPAAVRQAWEDHPYNGIRSVHDTDVGGGPRTGN